MADLTRVILHDQNIDLDFTINSNGRIEVSVEENNSGGTISSVNSSTTLLGIGGIFTGVSEDITNYSSIFVNVFSDVASATDGLSIEFSSDSTNWDEAHKYTISANSSLDLAHAAHAQYFRVVYTNGGTGQATFRLQTICKLVATPLLADRLGTNINDEESAALVRAVLAAMKPNGDYANIGATAGGNLKISLEETEPTSDTPEFFEDTSFVTGDSPVTLDCNTALGRNATEGYIINDGPGNFTASFSTDGAAFGDEITMKENEKISFEDITVDSLRLTWVADSAYRASVI